METGRTPPEKYGPAGEAMTRYSTSCEDRTPMNFSDAYINGRKYKLASSPAGTHWRSAETSAAMEPMKSVIESSGSARRRAEIARRAPLDSGRNDQIEPSAWREAFRPSNTSWA